MLRYISFFTLLLFIVACKPKVYTPKPAGYFHIDTPEHHEYVVFDRPGFPYTFEYPVYSKVVEDTVYQGKDHHPYWINIEFPSLNGVINVTYLEMSAKRPLDSLLNDASELSGFHRKKASGIEDTSFDNHHGVIGDIIYVGGNTASRYQFFATDSVKHFMRGSLYFDVTPNPDSLKPANDFILQDIKHMMGSLRWR